MLKAKKGVQRGGLERKKILEGVRIFRLTKAEENARGQQRKGRWQEAGRRMVKIKKTKGNKWMITRRKEMT